VRVTKEDTTIVGGAGDKAGVEGRCRQGRAQIEETSSDYDREKMQDRLALFRCQPTVQVEISRRKGVRKPLQNQTVRIP